MTYKKFGSKYVIRLLKEESVMATLARFCEAQNIKAAIVVSGLGAVDQATISYYELRAKEYHKKEFSGDHEVLSMTGNVALLDEKHVVHIHTVLGNTSYAAIGGHLHEARVSVTLEMILNVLDGEMRRAMDDTVGLNLLDLA